MPETFSSNEHAPYYSTYTDLVKHKDLIKAFDEHHTMFDDLDHIPLEKEDHRYAEDKWTIKELLQHVIDTERIFAYRALTIARVPGSALPGYDENAYARTASVAHRSLDEMIDELTAIRAGNVALFNSFTNEQLKAKGTADGKDITVRACGFIIIGHALHHIKILQQRYLS